MGVSEGEVYKLLEIPEKPGQDGALNAGNGVTDDLKVLIKVRKRHLFLALGSRKADCRGIGQSGGWRACFAYCLLQCEYILRCLRGQKLI